MITWVCSHAHSTKSISGGGEVHGTTKKAIINLNWTYNSSYIVNFSL